MAGGPDLPFRVYCVRSNAGAQREIVASFARYIEAEVFIHAELLHCDSRAADTGRYWGADGEGHQVHYWIETAQLAGAVRDTR